MNIKSIIFDLDGTLVNSVYDIGNSTNYALSKKGLPLRRFEDYYYLVGEGVQKLIENAVLPNAVDQETQSELVELMQSHYDKNWHNFTKPYPQIESLLEDLTENGIRMAVLSNKPDHFTKSMVQYFFPNIPFEYVHGARENQTKKPHPRGLLSILEKMGLDKESVLYVGDTKIDIQTCINAHVKSVGVTWGFRPKQELVEEGADFIIENPSELLNLIK
jgi:phosphoglycolate phosphatase